MTGDADEVFFEVMRWLRAAAAELPDADLVEAESFEQDNRNRIELNRMRIQTAKE